MSSAQTTSSLAADAPRYGSEPSAAYYVLNDTGDQTGGSGFISIYDPAGSSDPTNILSITTLPTCTSVVVTGTVTIVNDGTAPIGSVIVITVGSLMPGGAATFAQTIPAPAAPLSTNYSSVSVTAGCDNNGALIPAGTVIKLSMTGATEFNNASLCVWYQ